MEGQKEHKTLILLDGNGLMHRAFHAFPDLTTPNGELVNAVYGFTSILLQIINTHNPDYVICAFDLPAPTFRRIKFTDYKAKRSKMDGGLAGQFGRVKEILQAMDIPIFAVEGFEADDVIGTLATQASKEGIKVEVITGDKDLLQLVSRNIKVITPGKRFTETKVYDEDTFQAEYGFQSQYLIEYKGLRGDTSDNIPGIKGIGEKGAKALIGQYHTLEAIYDDIDNIDKKYRNKLQEGRESAFMSRELSTIVTDMDISLQLHQFADFDYDRVYTLLQELSFKSLLSRLPKFFKDDPTFSYKACWIAEEDIFTELLEKVRESKLFSLFVYGDNEDFMKAKIEYCAIGLQEGIVYCFSWESFGTFSKNIQRGFVDILESSEYRKIGYNLKFMYHAFFNMRIHFQGIFFDTLLAQYVLNPGVRIGGVKEQAMEFLQLSFTDFKELTNNGKISFVDIKNEELLDCLCKGAEILWRLFEYLDARLEGRVRDVFANIEMPLITVLAKMERSGILIDHSALEQDESFFERRITEIQDDIFEVVGHEFNISSPRQLGNVLFDELQLPAGRKNKTGRSTDDKTLLALESIHPVVAKIREYREVTKLYSTYIVSLKKLIFSDGRLHTSFNQSVAATGRLSSTNPNLQNIPIRTELGRKIRSMFIAPKESTLLSLDYSQIELRLLAHYSRDPVLITAFREKKDIHSATASEIFNVPIEKVSADQRRIAKIINFGIAYGMSEFGLSEQLGISRAQAKDYIQRYFEKYKNVAFYVDQILEQVKREGYVETMMGRRRNIFGINDSNWHIREQSRREAINMPLQGTNADMIKLAMIRIQQKLEYFPVKIMMILQVHDELLFEVNTQDDAQLKELSEMLVELMIDDVSLEVPVIVEAKVGTNWERMTHVYSNL